MNGVEDATGPEPAVGEQPRPAVDAAELPRAPMLAPPAASRAVSHRGPAAAGWRPIVAVCVVTAVVAAALGGCLRLTGSEPAPEEGVVARAIVGPSGTIVAFDEGARLIVPQGAVEGRHTITVRRRSPRDLDPISRERGTPHRVYAFAPAGLRFQEPVTLELPAPPTDRRSSAAVLARGALRMIRGELDPATGMLRVRTMDLRFERTLAPEVDPGHLEEPE